VNQAAWKCDDCRRSGLERSRQCGFLGKEMFSGPRIVWARGKHFSTECPKSYITAESLYLIERYYVLKRFGIKDIRQLPARVVDALLILERDHAEDTTHDIN
jgi:hypothetical protein